jgi:hypothetical protein
MGKTSFFSSNGKKLGFSLKLYLLVGPSFKPFSRQHNFILKREYRKKRFFQNRLKKASKHHF